MATERYNPRASEPRWQKAWDEAKLFETTNDDPRPKYYVLEMFPYPSGRIHMGHVRNYAMGDVVARFRRAMGYNVLHPMGWDAFGLPAENAARDNKVNPRDWTYANIATMKGQLKTMGLSLDWTREIATCDPSYYQHQQKMFLDFWQRRAGRAQVRQGQLGPGRHDRARQRAGDRRPRLALRRAGRAARPDAMVLQDHVDVAGAARRPRHARPLAGKGPRHAAELDRPLRGPADPLADRDRHRAGRRDRARGLHDAARHDLRRLLHGDRRPTIRWPGRRPQTNPALQQFIDEVHHMGTSLAALETAEKKGFDTGIRVVHPFDPDWTLPVYVANFVLMDYGTGAIFGCPSGDQRDLDFANKYGLPVIPVVMPEGADAATFQIIDEAYVDDGVMINSRFLDGMKPKQAFDEVATAAGAASTIGNRPMAERKVQFRLRDWLISRQRYWGCPIPVIHCDACGAVPVPDSDLPVRLPDDVDVRQARQSARPSSDLEACRLPAMRQAGAPRHRHDGHVRRFVLVFRALHRPVERERSRRRCPASTARAAGCRSTSISAASSTRSCTCSIRASSPAP